MAIVTFADSALGRAYVAETSLEWPVLIDTERRLYHAFGMHRARLTDIWSLKTARAYIHAIASGQRLRESQEDVYQRGGDVLIDPDGVTRMRYVGSGPADRPSVESLMQVVRPTRSTE